MVKKFSTPKHSLAEKLSHYSRKEQRWILIAARHLKKYNKITDRLKSLDDEVAELEYEETE